MDLASVGIGSYDKRCIILTGLENAKNRARQAILAQLPTESEDALDKKENSLIAPDGIQISESGMALVEGQAFELYKLFINPSAFCKLQTDVNQSRLFRVDAGLLDLMSLRESRQVTTVFIKIGSLISWESERTLSEAQKGFTIVQEALKKYEGSLRQMHVDDKGATILIFFGLPPIAHENDASIGLKAGLEISKHFSQVYADFSIGVTTGMVSLGGVGNEFRIEYAVVCYFFVNFRQMGDPINMAARLMCLPKASRKVLCDEKTYLMTQSEFDFDILGKITVKGKSIPIDIFCPVSIREETPKHQNSPENVALIGREGERTLIRESIEAHSSASGPRMLVVEGDGGMGLSTLARWTNYEVEKRGFRIGYPY